MNTVKWSTETHFQKVHIEGIIKSKHHYCHWPEAFSSSTLAFGHLWICLYFSNQIIYWSTYNTPLSLEWHWLCQHSETSFSSYTPTNTSSGLMRSFGCAIIMMAQIDLQIDEKYSLSLKSVSILPLTLQLIPEIHAQDLIIFKFKF